MIKPTGMCSHALSLIVSFVFVATASAQTPDSIYYNGKVVTVNEEFDLEQAVAVNNGSILAVGSTKEIRALAGPGTKQIDLKGQLLLPGFYDNHVHLGGPLQPWKWAGMIERVPEWIRGVKDIPELRAAIATQASKLKKGEWIIGELPREDWPNDSLPTRADYDDVSPDNPVAIARGPHTLLVNTVALKLAGVTRDTKVPGGQITLGVDGEPTGKILESAKKVMYSVMPGGGHSHASSDSETTDDARLISLNEQFSQLVELGVTSVNVAGVRPVDLPMVEKLYNRYGDSLPRMSVQLRVSPGYDTHDDVDEGARESIGEIEAIGDPSNYFKHPKLKLGGVKMSIDGGLSAPVFWSTKEYENRPGFYGVQRIPDETFLRVAKRAHALGWQLGIHTMGDAAAVMVVDQLEKILAANPRSDHRHYLHHVAVLPPKKTLQKMGKLNINVASQPGFLLSLGSFADEALEPEREATQNPSRSLLDHGVRVSYGSDAGPYGPLAIIFAATTRTGWNGVVHGAEEAVTIREAIEMHTLEPAYFTFDEKERGSIEPGKVADFVVLDKDILAIDPRKIPEVNVVRTIVGGEQLFVRKE